MNVRIDAVRIGRVQAHMWAGREVHSGAVKSAVDRPVFLGYLGFDGDEQGDTINHGGPEKAALLYAGHHYPRWRSEQGLDLPDGALFENLTLGGVDLEGPSTSRERLAQGTGVQNRVPSAPVRNERGRIEGLPERLAHGPDETTVVLGEQWRIGGAIVEVTQPRSPCWKLARRWGIPDLVQRVQQTGWSGWYVRVLEPGLVAPGDTVEILAKPDEPTVGDVARIMNEDKRDLDGAHRLLRSTRLPARWRERLERRLAGATEDDSARTSGP